MTPIGWRCENAQYWASWRKFWLYNHCPLQSTFKGTGNYHMESHHIQFDRPRHLCSKPAQATSSESSTAQSSERPSWSQPMGSCAATEKWWVQPSSLSKRKANISNVYKCIVSNIAIYDYPYHDWFYIRVYNIIYTYLYVYIYRVIYHSYCAYVCSLTSHSWTHDTHTHKHDAAATGQLSAGVASSILSMLPINLHDVFKFRSYSHTVVHSAYIHIHIII